MNKARYIQGNIWMIKSIPVLIVITTNSTLKENGELVMGAGIALEAAQKSPTLPKDCGEIVKMVGPRYGFQTVRSPRVPDKAGLGIFQTKKDWREPASLSLIRHSAEMLREHAQFNADIPMRLNFPGIGMGGLKREQVEPILDEMFGDVENVIIYFV